MESKQQTAVKYLADAVLSQRYNNGDIFDLHDAIHKAYLIEKEQLENARPQITSNCAIKEISDEEIKKAAENYGWTIKTNTFSDPVKANELAESAKQDFIEGAKWYREQLKKQQ